MADITFRYNRAPTGELSGASMVEQTEQALSEISRESSQAQSDAAEALRVARIAETTAGEAQTAATNAQETAQAAGTAAATAQATATQAVASAQGAQAAAQGAAQTATAAAQSASAAQTAAQNSATAAQQSEAKADQAVQTANSAVTTAGQAVTTANGAVTRAAQAETNVGNAVSAANQAAQSAQNAAASAAQLADPNRYSAKTTALTLSAGQTVNISDLDNPNVAVGNKIVDALGNIFEIASIDTTAQTVTLGAADPDATPPTTGFWENPNHPPVGSYIHFAGSSVPDHYLLCNGAAVSRTTYSALFAVIGTTYGSGDGSTTFNLPDADGRVLQGVSDLTKVGVSLDSKLPNITGKTALTNNDNQYLIVSGAASVGAFKASSANQRTYGTNPGSLQENVQIQIFFDASGSNSIYDSAATRVQAPAIQTLIAIRYE